MQKGWTEVRIAKAELFLGTCRGTLLMLVANREDPDSIIALELKRLRKPELGTINNEMLERELYGRLPECSSKRLFQRLNRRITEIVDELRSGTFEATRDFSERML